MEILENKLKKLKEYLGTLNSVAVAFSSGVDSTFLLKVASVVLKDRVVAYTIKSNLIPQDEIDEASAFCKNEKIKHKIIEANVFDIDGFKNNPIDRCYICKKELFKKIIENAKKENIENVIEGSNIDDISDYRPGMKAVEELNIKSPLQFAKLTKNEIRELSEKYNLKTFNKQSMACLASRIPYYEEITEKKLDMISKSEKILFEFGFKNYRVRIHGNNLSRIEVLPEEFEKLIQKRKEITVKLKEIGFKYVSMDLEGYRTGAMNEVL